MPDLIRVRGARVHNLKGVDIDIPKGSFTVMTGLSGSGKSSLAFDTIYAEGQRRYMESLSSFARQFLEVQDRPDVDELTGLSPTIAIDQKTASTNPRSTVGTVTEMYDALRVLFARAGVPHCPECRVPVREVSVRVLAERLWREGIQEGGSVWAPLAVSERGEVKGALEMARAQGVAWVRVDGVRKSIEAALAARRQSRARVIEAQGEAGVWKGGAATLAAVEQALTLAFSLSEVALVELASGGAPRRMRQGRACEQCGWSAEPLEPAQFSFNTPRGACSACTGLGVRSLFDPALVIPNRRFTIAEGAIKPWSRIAGQATNYMRLISQVGEKHGFTIHTSLSQWSEAMLGLLLRGTGTERYGSGAHSVVFPGVLGLLEQKYRETDSDYVRSELESYMRTVQCPECHGLRLRPESLAVEVLGRTLEVFTHTPLSQVEEVLTALERDARREPDATRLVVERVARELRVRVEHVCQVGLGYLTLDRSAVSLSGGESQRLRLATQLGTNLSGVVYILDEPSIGLHPRDTGRLVETVQALRDAGNTVIVVEHDESIIRAADYVIDIGPGAGIYGGTIVAHGVPNTVLACAESLTGQYLSGTKVVPMPAKRLPCTRGELRIVGAHAFNLQHISVGIPLGVMTSVTGVSGSGKSTLILDVLGKALARQFFRAKEEPGAHAEIHGLDLIDKVVMVDQSPIGRTPRSNPATYTGVFTAIRDVFAELPEARARGLDPGTFSFNVKGGGRCEECGGDGMTQIAMQFMPDVYVTCRACAGSRYHKRALDILWNGHTIADILNLTVEEAVRVFEPVPAIADKLRVLSEVGLGYMKLGQSATTLSGGEAQRVKLATELARRSTGKTLYILDEPTTGLHFEDVRRLLDVLRRLVDKGNTVLMVEHNMDVVRASDWVIDMGPDGGAAGGRVVAEGTPEQVAKSRLSATAPFLASALASADAPARRAPRVAPRRKS
jgi:excinuclease ABC subunit A